MTPELNDHSKRIFCRPRNDAEVPHKLQLTDTIWRSKSTFSVCPPFVDHCPVGTASKLNPIEIFISLCQHEGFVNLSGRQITPGKTRCDLSKAT